MQRRQFLGFSLAAIGGIFAPKFEPWFPQAKVLAPAPVAVAASNEEALLWMSSNGGGFQPIMAKLLKQGVVALREEAIMPRLLQLRDAKIDEVATLHAIHPEWIVRHRPHA